MAKTQKIRLRETYVLVAIDEQSVPIRVGGTDVLGVVSGRVAAAGPKSGLKVGRRVFVAVDEENRGRMLLFAADEIVGTIG